MQAFRPFAQGMTYFMQNHLGQAVVGIQGFGRTNGQDPIPIPRGIHFVAALDSHAHSLSRVYPNERQGVGVCFLDIAHWISQRGSGFFMAATFEALNKAVFAKNLSRVMAIRRNQPFHHSRSDADGDGTSRETVVA